MAREEDEEREIRDDVSDDNNNSDEEGDDALDSSDEEDDDDEEEIQKVREGFIVDDEDDDEIQTKRKKKHRKRKRDKERSTRDVDDALDEDDLELLLENSGVKPTSSTSGQFKRLKRAQVEEVEEEEPQEETVSTSRRSGLNNMFDDEAGEEEDVEDEATGDDNRRNILDEFEDFIEEDELSEDDEQTRLEKRTQRERARSTRPRIDTSKLSSVDRESLQQLYEVFGDGAEYDWALQAQEDDEERHAEAMEPTSLDEVFEHAELKERMLTQEDNVIRIIDIPERFQTYRANLNYINLEDEELEREKVWVANALFSEKQSLFAGDLEAPFKAAVGHVVEFVSKSNYEVPFIWSHRRDFLLHSSEVQYSDGRSETEVHKLLFEDDLWRIVHLDVEYHSLYEKRLNIERIVDELQLDDDLVRDIKSLDTMVAVQDIFDYIHFTYSAEIRDLANNQEATANEENPEAPVKNSKKHSKYAFFERIRSNVLYDAVKSFGISAKEFGENVQDQSAKQFLVPYRIHATDDSQEAPGVLVERICEDEDAMFKDHTTARDAVCRTFAEEIFHNPKVRQEVRSTYKSYASINVSVTEKGKSIIDKHSPYADIKYAINRSPADLVSKPDVLLRMLEAEAAGLIVIQVDTKDYDNWFQSILSCLRSDGTSEISDEWNAEREYALSLAFKKLNSMISQNAKEDLRRECERLIAAEVRTRFLGKIDQAPFTPFGFDKGTKPNVLALSFGKGDFDSAVVGVLLKENGKIDEFFKSENNPARDRENKEQFQGQLKEFFDKNLEFVKPDVIVVSGYNANSKKLFDIIQEFVEEERITVNIDDLPDESNPPLISVIWGQDETARLYQNSEKASQQFPDRPSLIKYCIGLARYVQNPLLEYVALGNDILSLTFYEYQTLIPRDLILEVVESAFVDIINTVGVEINEAVRDPHVAQLVPYIAGLGPRKASGLIRNINTKLGSTLTNRSELIEAELSTANIFINCASFLNIPYDESSSAARDPSVELLDATRIHPEDYDLAKKMASDALDVDEEDLPEIDNNGGIIYQLMQEGANKLDELNLIAYGKELETKFDKRKFATLQMIKEELVNNYEELRHGFHTLDNLEVFQMLTGETPETFGKNILVPVTVMKVGKNFRDESSSIKWVKVITSSLIQANIEEYKIPRDIDLDFGQIIQAVVLEVFYESFSASLSLLEEDIRRAGMPKFRKEEGKWDFRAESEDLKQERAKERAKQAKSRGIQHPLYHDFNYKQAEEFLAPKNIGDCIIRPSSKGVQYLTITWKVANNLFQHLLVKDGSSGKYKAYYVDNKKYEDLDQLIFQHIQAIARKVREMINHPKFREGTLSEVNEWLESYTKANPKNSAYVFCFDHKTPGSFLLLFKVNANSPVITWHVKSDVEGYSLKGFPYPNMLKLCNGFKQMYKSEASKVGGAVQNSRPQVGTYGGYGGY
ncbi:SH2 domain-containing protein [Scheffersomyces coipomensis]|uniref:SH2 domain-containing protein n=1 Tax=Scheffersomyces coipomensis TaxID=1788519 RepID=UPI00315C85F0